MPWVKTEDCTGCMVCARVCPVEGALTLKDGAAWINQELCTHCHACMDVCPMQAIRPNHENPELRGKYSHRHPGPGHRHH